MNDYTRRIKLKVLTLKAISLLGNYRAERECLHELYSEVVRYTELVRVFGSGGFYKARGNYQRAFLKQLATQGKVLEKLSAINVQRRELRRHKAGKQAKIW